jgi:PAS domain S-box-containing protein
MKPGFLDKLMARIGRIDPDDVQTYLARLAQEKGFLETIFHALREGIIVTGPDGAITFINDAAARLFGRNADDVIGRPIAETVRGLDWESLTRSSRSISRDMEVFYPDHRSVNFYVVPLALSDRPGRGEAGVPPGEVIGYAMLLRDITESRKTAEANLESEKLSALTLLAAGVAHEIGNPLNSLHIHLQILERKLRKLPEASRGPLLEAARVARDEIKRLDHIVSQFLRAIRPAPLDLRPENINEIVRDALAFLAPEIKNRDILVEQEFASDLPRVMIDRDQLKQAFYNIIKNSVQAMQRGGILRAATGATDDHVWVAFVDSGGGIPADVLARVFDPYFTTKETGSGLGLLVVRRIVREHGGEVDIVNDEGRGVTFTIRLPLKDRRPRMLPDK